MLLDRSPLLNSRHSKSNVRKSNSIRGLSSIEFGNRTKSNTTLSVSSISEQIEFNRTNRTQSNSIRLIVFDWLWWTYTKQAQSKPVKASFSCAFFTIYSITQTPFINCPRQLREQNRTNPENFAILDVKAAFLVAFDYTFEAYDPQRIWSHFCGISSFTKNTCATLRAEVTRASKIW